MDPETFALASLHSVTQYEEYLDAITDSQAERQVSKLLLVIEKIGHSPYSLKLLVSKISSSIPCFATGTSISQSVS